MDSLVVVVDVDLVSVNRTLAEHFWTRHRRRKREREATRKALDGKVPPPGPRWSVVLTRVSSRRLDDDAIGYACKAVRDEIAAWLGVDDGPKGPVLWVYDQSVERHPAPWRRTRQGMVRPRKTWAVFCRVEIRGVAEAA